MKSHCPSVEVKETTSKGPESTAPNFGLVRGPRLLEIIFPEKDSRPSLKSLERYVKRRLVPSVKLGRQRFYSPPAVREALLSKTSSRGGAN